MRLKTFLLVIAIAQILGSCGVSKQLKQLNIEAQAAFRAADYQVALVAFDSIININTSKNKEATGEVYREAGIAAWKLKQTQKAIDYLEKAKSKTAANAKAYYCLAEAYLEIDNLSREITNLELYLENYLQGENIDAVRRQLFIAYAESTNWDLGLDLWSKLSSDHKTEAKVLRSYLKINQGLGNDDQVIELATQLLKVDPNSKDALEALAHYYYRIAEDNYQLEMRAYEKNRTTRQYRQLLNALEVINSNFRTSRDYFERLYKIDPNPQYASILGNIYTRFDNKSRANFYYRKAKEN